MDQNRALNKNQKLIIFSGFMFIIILSSILTLSLAVLFFQIIMGLITLFFCFKTDYKTAKLWLAIFSISIFFVFLIFLANKFNYGVPYYIGGSDDLQFEQWGYDVYNSGIYNPSKIMELKILGQFHNSPFFPVYIAILINFAELFGGYTTFLPRIANVYFLLWICMIIKYLLLMYTNLSRKSIYYALVFFAFMPNIQYINAHVFRDTFNLFQVLLIALLVDFLLRKNNFIMKITSIATLTLLIFYTYYTRVSSILFAGILILLMLSAYYRIKTRYIIIAIFPLIIFSNVFEVFRLGFYIEYYSSYVANIAGDGLSRVVFNRPLLPLGILFRILYAFITPFPNFLLLFKDSSKLLFDFSQFLIYLGVVVQIFATPFILKRTLKFDWLSLIFSSWFLAVIVSTFTFRHFLFFYPFMSAVAVDGFFCASPNSRKTILFLTTLSIIGLGMLYLIIKTL